MSVCVSVHSAYPDQFPVSDPVPVQSFPILPDRGTPPSLSGLDWGTHYWDWMGVLPGLDGGTPYEDWMEVPPWKWMALRQVMLQVACLLLFPSGRLSCFYDLMSSSKSIKVNVSLSMSLSIIDRFGQQQGYGLRLGKWSDNGTILKH